MAFNVNLTMRDGGVAVLTLSGDLDASSAPALKDTVALAAAERPTRVFLVVKDLSYMASAGLRVLIFAKQKLGPATEVVVVGAQPAVRSTITLTGFDRSVLLVDEMPEA